MTTQERQQSGRQGRPPHGGRGLKSPYTPIFSLLQGQSPSPRRAWIEMFILDGGNGKNGASPSPRRAWIEIPILHE